MRADMVESPDKLEHLEWAILARATNQKTCLKLLRLFDKYSSLWKTKDRAAAAQDLVSVGFSLWRAAFLAEKTGLRSEVFSHGRQFLEKMIEDNAIAYVQDKSSREWTFNYYTRNARSSLQRLAFKWPDAVSPYVNKARTPTQRWDYCQQLFDEAVEGFEALFEKRSAERKAATQRRQRRAQKRANRATVRKITLKRRSLPKR